MSTAPTTLRAALTLAAGLALVLGCGDAARAPSADVELLVDRVHDLVTLLPEAELEGRNAYRGSRVATVQEADLRDRIMPLRLFSSSSLRYPELVVRGDAELNLRVGRYAALDDTAAPVRLRIEAVRAAGEAGDELSLTLLDEIRDPAALDAEGLTPGLALGLPSAAPETLNRWSIRFACELVEGPEQGWLALFNPTVRSAGRPVASGEWPLERERFLADLVGTLDAAEVLAEPFARALRRGSLDPAVGYAGAGGRRPTLILPAPSRVAWELPLPAEAAQLRFSYGVDDALGWSQGGDGMAFAVEIDGERVWSTELLAPQLQRDRGWKAAQLPLATSGQPRTIRLELITEPLGDAQHDVGGFADARVVTLASIPRLLDANAPTVVMVVIDTLRADHVTEALMPRMSAFAEAGVRYTAARSSSSWTWPATASLLTGLPPTAHHVRDAESSYLDDGLATVAEAFADAGYTTAGFVANPIVGASDNFDQGFETWLHLPNARGGSLNLGLRNWLENTDGLARFIYFHAFDPHAPYLSPGDTAAAAEAERDKQILKTWAETSQDLDAIEQSQFADSWVAAQRARYAREVSDTDAVFDELIETLRAHVTGELIVAFTNDHGEEFRDHGQLSHGPHLYDETVAAPLWVVVEGASAPAPALIDEVVETRGLASTLLQLAGLTPLDGPLQQSLPLTPQQARPRPAFSQTFLGVEPGQPKRVEKRAVVYAGHKLIHTPASGRLELFDLSADPLEQHDLSAEQPDRAQLLRRKLDDWIAATTATRGERNESDPEAAERLRQIGYMGDNKD